MKHKIKRLLSLLLLFFGLALPARPVRVTHSIPLGGLQKVRNVDRAHCSFFRFFVFRVCIFEGLCYITHHSLRMRDEVLEVKVNKI